MYSKRLNRAIPGGAHTYSRGDDQFPANAPQLFSKGKGAYVYGPDGEEFVDYGLGLRSVTLGYAEPRVNAAAIAQINNGNNLPRASLIELEAAETLIDLIPSVEMIKFAKHGSTVTTAAVKLARAATGRKYIARCKEHPFFSFDDWFIGDTPLTFGIPEEYQKLTLHFSYNNLTSLEELFAKFPNQIAGVILEPATTSHPEHDFLSGVRKLCTKNNAVLILDEMITGFRWHLQGAQTYYSVEPDLCTFGKAMANGFSVAALAGKRELMDLGGITVPGREKLFLTSTTHGAEMCSLGAFVETVRVYKEDDVIARLWNYGERLTKGINAVAAAKGIEKYFYVEGIPCSPHFITLDKTGSPCLGMRTLFAQEMFRNGVFMSWIALSSAHGDEELAKTLLAADAALAIYADALEAGYTEFLNGPVIKPVFRKYV